MLNVYVAPLDGLIGSSKVNVIFLTKLGTACVHVPLPLTIMLDDASCVPPSASISNVVIYTPIDVR